jgi:hypothetical protein
VILPPLVFPGSARMTQSTITLGINMPVCLVFHFHAVFLYHHAACHYAQSCIFLLFYCVIMLPHVIMLSVMAPGACTIKLLTADGTAHFKNGNQLL